MKTLRNLFLVVALTCTFAMADGHTGTGGRCDTCPPCTENCFTEDGESSTGAVEITTNEGEPDNTTAESWSEWFLELIGYSEF